MVNADTSPLSMHSNNPAGALVGCSAAHSLLPPAWQRDWHLLRGDLGAGVPLSTGLLCEFGCSFWLNFVVMHAIHSRRLLLSFVAPLAATWALVTAGMGLTGPSMNPAFTFAWCVRCKTALC